MFLTIITFVLNGSYYVYTFFTTFMTFLHTVLPFGMDIGLAGIAAFYLSRLRKPEEDDVVNVFGPELGTQEYEQCPQKVVRCIAHRGAGLDAPENTMMAFKYCVERDCKFVELDVRTSRDGKLVLLHDQGLERLTGSEISDVRTMNWEKIKDLDVGAHHPNREQFKEVRLCLLDDALDFLLENKVRIIIDVKGQDKEVVEGVLNIFSTRPNLYQHAAVTCFNPLQMYQIRKRDPRIVGAISYRPYGFSAADYDAENGPSNPRFAENLPLHALLRAADTLHSLLWRWSAKWCNVSAVLLHKDIVSPTEVQYWRSLGVRCIGWSVNRPLEKLYWRGVLRAPYLSNTLLGEPEMEKTLQEIESIDQNCKLGPILDENLASERKTAERTELMSQIAINTIHPNN